MVAVSGPVKTVYIGAQVAVDGAGNIVGKGNLAAQTEQILRNIDACLEDVGAGREHLIHWSIYIAEGQDMRPAFEAGMRWLGDRPNPPMNNVMYVSGFWPADLLISIEAIAVVPLAG
jgi:enamine deaminase RidA (YjgF/YER057c/UK114 family)